jgi:hypothetical protein
MFVVTITNSFETFEAFTFGEAVRQARRRKVECSIWDQSITTNWGNKLVAVYCPKRGLKDLRVNHGSRAHQQHRVGSTMKNLKAWISNDPWITAMAVTLIILVTLIFVLR